MASRPGPTRIGARAPEAALEAVYRRARRLATLRKTLAAALDPGEAAHLAGVSGEGARLVIFADSAAWATRLRYRAPQFERALREQLGLCPQLIFRVLPESERVAPPSRAGLPARARAALESAARTIRDPDLAGALRRLAHRDQKP